MFARLSAKSCEWTTFEDTNFVYGQVTDSRSENPPLIHAYGVITPVADCEAACYADNECYAYVYFTHYSSDFFINCFGMSFSDSIQFHAEANTQSKMCLDTASDSKSTELLISSTFIRCIPEAY